MYFAHYILPWFELFPHFIDTYPSYIYFLDTSLLPFLYFFGTYSSYTSYILTLSWYWSFIYFLDTDPSYTFLYLASIILPWYWSFYTSLIIIPHTLHWYWSFIYFLDTDPSYTSWILTLPLPPSSLMHFLYPYP